MNLPIPPVTVWGHCNNLPLVIWVEGALYSQAKPGTTEWALYASVRNSHILCTDSMWLATIMIPSPSIHACIHFIEWQIITNSVA